MDTMGNYSDDCDMLRITRDIIGINLRKGRLEKNWSQSKTRAEAGSCQSTVANLGAGKAKNPGLFGGITGGQLNRIFNYTNEETSANLMGVFYYLYANLSYSVVHKLAMFLLIAFLLTSCCRRAWKVYRKLPTPDEAYRTGTTHGYTVHIWNCYHNKRVVVYQFSAEMSCKDPEKEEVACGEQAEIEKELEGQDKKPLTDLSKW